MSSRDLIDRNINNTRDTPDVKVVFNKRKYKLQRIPNDFLASEISRQTLLNIINIIETCRERQNDVDKLYDTFCTTIIDEMNRKIQYTDCGKTAKKRYKIYKPYWDGNLETCWQTMRRKEKEYVNYRGTNHRKRELLLIFKTARSHFDKCLRKAERHYKRNLSLDIEMTCTSNPKLFWNQLKNLGPKRKHHIPEEIYDDHGQIQNDWYSVSSKWSNEFEGLYNQSDTNEFDDNFFNNIKQEKLFYEDQMLEPLFTENQMLNRPILRSEVETVVGHAKNGKSVGYDQLPYEILKLPVIVDVLHSLFKLCLETSITPSVWRTAIISPIPKDPSKDARVPLNYRGISLLSTVSKLYSSILNNRLMSYLETENILVDEQNGFRKGRSCQDHIFSVCSIVRNRLSQNKSTFAMYIDLQKAFDFVDRDALLYKLLRNGINGKFYNSIKSMYQNNSSCIKLNGILTPWFPVTSGVRQGDNISPTLFSLYINDLAIGLKGLNKGIELRNENIPCLLYADDIILLSENEENLQSMLDYIHTWCRKWRLKINRMKSNAMHFRNKRKRRSDFVFYLGDESLEYACSYRYLGVMLNEHLDYDIIAETLVQSAGRALGGVISKIHDLLSFFLDILHHAHK